MKLNRQKLTQKKEAKEIKPKTSKIHLVVLTTQLHKELWYFITLNNCQASSDRHFQLTSSPALVLKSCAHTYCFVSYILYTYTHIYHLVFMMSHSVKRNVVSWSRQTLWSNYQARNWPLFSIRRYIKIYLTSNLFLIRIWHKLSKASLTLLFPS